MSEDSITSSPSKSNKSIHEARLIRKNKRKKADEHLRINSDHNRNVVGLHKTIRDFYQDSDEEHTENEPKNVTLAKPSAIIRNYKPFEMEKSLAIADHITTDQIRPNKPNILLETQSFFTCVTELELGREQYKDLSDNNKQNSSFSITESELISCCHKAEEILQCGTTTPKEEHNTNVIAQDLTPTKNDDMFLVNSILQDFSQSPLSREQTRINTCYQYTPEFRLHRQPVKTYSRKILNGTKTNLNSRFEEQTSVISDDDNDSNSSSLSIQEDVTVGEIINNQAADTGLNNTQRLCENLLNLSVYFTQNNHSRQNLSLESQLDHPQVTNDSFLMDNSEESMLFSDNRSDLIKDILKLRYLYANKIRLDSYNSNEDFPGFYSHEEESERDVIDVDNGALDSMQTTLNLKMCDNRVTIVAFNNEDNTSLEDWYNEDCQDIFANINTENILYQENVNNSNNENRSPKNNEKHVAAEILKQDPIPNKSLGFKTASSKPIKVSREAHIIASKILSNLPDIPEFAENTKPKNCDTTNEVVNIFENHEDEWNDDCDLFLNFQTPMDSKEKPKENELNTNFKQVYAEELPVVPSTSKMASVGFKTAGGRNVHISRKAQESVQKLLNEFASESNASDHCEDELKDMKCKVYAKTHKFEIEQKEKRSLQNKEQIIVANQGFQTAKGKDITISRKAQESVKCILNEFCLESEQNFENDLIKIKQNINKKNNENKPSIVESNVSKDFQLNSSKNIDFSKEAEGPINSRGSNALENNMGFQTANGKKLITSTKTQKSVDKLLKEFFVDTKDDFLSDLETLKYDINKRNEKSKVEVKITSKQSSNCGEHDDSLTDIMMLSEWPLAKEMETVKTKKESLAKSSLNTNEGEEIRAKIGFQTANGKQVAISEKAQQSVKKLLQEFSTDLDIEKYENDLKDIKTKILHKNKELKLSEGSSIKTKSCQISKAYEDITLSQRFSNEADVIQQNHTPKTTNGKRKYSIDNSDITTPGTNTSPPAKLANKTLYNTKSTLTEQSLKSPLAAHSVILRKNLLSLTKRRRSKRNSLTLQNEEIPKINKERYDLNVSAETPIKSNNNSLAITVQTPATPNLKEFITNAPLTSTPLLLSNRSKSPQTIKDTDFQPITWQNNDSTAHTTKLSDNSSSNITLNSSNPTAKERIGRLKMFGKAPAVSPILIDTHHNCRPSGLRRTRSMLKKTEK